MKEQTGGMGCLDECLCTKIVFVRLFVMVCLFVCVCVPFVFFSFQLGCCVVYHPVWVSKMDGGVPVLFFYGYYYSISRDESIEKSTAVTGNWLEIGRKTGCRNSLDTRWALVGWALVVESGSGNWSESWGNSLETRWRLLTE